MVDKVRTEARQPLRCCRENLSRTLPAVVFGAEALRLPDQQEPIASLYLMLAIPVAFAAADGGLDRKVDEDISNLCHVVLSVPLRFDE